MTRILITENLTLPLQMSLFKKRMVFCHFLLHLKKLKKVRNMFKFNNKGNNLTIVFIVNFEHISHLFLVLLVGWVKLNVIYMQSFVR